MLISENPNDATLLELSNPLMTPVEDPFNFGMDYSLHQEDDVFQQLSRELELPLLMSSPSHHSSDEEILRDNSPLPSSLLEPFCCLGAMDDVDPMNWESDSFARLDSLADDIVCEIKDEIKLEPSSPSLFPSSPSPSPSNSSSESWSVGESSSDVKMTLETPPITPPQQDGSPPTSPSPNKTNESVVLVSPVKIVPLLNNGVGVGSNNSQKIIITSPAVNIKKRPIIQPKPSPAIASSVPTVTLPKSAEESRTIVLSAQDFAALTQGKRSIKPVSKVRIQPLTPAQQKTVPVSVKWEPGVTVSQAKIPILKNGVAPAPVMAALSAAPVSLNQESEVKAIKRQQRMIKNRESACLSRKKKKEYVTALETELLQLKQENVKLKLENASLRERLAQHEETQPCKKPFLNLHSTTKKTTAVFALLFMVSLNIGSFGNLLYSAPDKLPSVQSKTPVYPNARHGRSLLWADVDKRGLPDMSASIVANRSAHPTCPMSINQTESLRLDSELRRWIGMDVETADNWFPSQSPTSFMGELFVSQPRARKIKPKKKRRTIRKVAVPTNEVELYGLRPHQYNYAPFFEKIHRRDDTFYLVSFSGDHLLLPALAHNKTVRPKMSFVLPELSLNDSSSSPAEHITMMQIDCEVTNTQVLQVSEMDIPAHLRQRNHTTKVKTDQFGPQARQPYKPYFLRTGDLNVQFATNRTSESAASGTVFSSAAGKYAKQKNFSDLV